MYIKPEFLLITLILFDTPVDLGGLVKRNSLSNLSTTSSRFALTFRHIAFKTGVRRLLIDLFCLLNLSFASLWNKIVLFMNSTFSSITWIYLCIYLSYPI